MSAPDPTVLIAAEAILTERYEAAKRDANRDAVYAVYVTRTARTVGVDPAEAIVEAAIRDNMVAEAKFRAEQMDRFADALDKLRRFKR